MKSLAQSIRAKLANNKVEAVSQMARELEAIELGRNTLAQLLSFDRPDTLAGVEALDAILASKLELSAATFFETQLVEFKAYLPTLHNAFRAEAPLTKYTLGEVKDLIRWPLLASDDVNHLARLRAHYTMEPSSRDKLDPKEYGPTQEWFVWYSHGAAICKVRAWGSIGALVFQFPDAATAFLRAQAGVSPSPFVPLFICRATVVAAMAERLAVLHR